MHTSLGLNRNAAKDGAEAHWYELCFMQDGVKISQGGHFAVSAGTGYVAGNLE